MPSKRREKKLIARKLRVHRGFKISILIGRIFFHSTSLSSSLYKCQQILLEAPSHVSITSLNLLICALSGTGISKNDRKNQEPNKYVATKSDLILLSSISLQLRVSNRAKLCSMCNFHDLSESVCWPLYPFWSNQPKSLFVKTSLHVSKYRCFHFSCIFHIFYIGKLHYCQEGMYVPICVCTGQECINVPIYAYSCAGMSV